MTWLGSDFTARECDDPWIQLCFRGREDPLDQHWQEIALRVFGPLLAHRSEVEL